MGLRSILSKVFSSFAVVVQPVLRNVSWAKLFGAPEEMKPEELVKHYKHWVYRASTMNANAVASVPLRLYVITNRGQKAYPNLRRGIDTRAVAPKQLEYLNTKSHLVPRLRKAVLVEEVTEHPVLTILQTANQQYDGFELLELWQLFCELVGDGYIWMQPNALGIPQGLWVLQSQYVTIVPGDENEGLIKGYLYGMSKDKQIALSADEVTHLRFPNPHSVFYGLSPQQAVFSAVKRKEDYDVYEDALLKNNARPDFLLKHKNKVHGRTLKQIREQWMQLYGKDKTGMPAVLEGDIDIQELGFTPREVSYLKGQKFTRDEILNAYGIPISKVTTEAVNLANAEVGEVQYQRDTIVPRLKRAEQKLNQDFISKFDERLFIAFDNPVPEDKQFQLTKQTAYLDKGVLTINEVREKEGLEPVPWGKVAWLSNILLPVSSGAPPVSPEEDEEKTQKKGGSSTAGVLPPMHFHIVTDKGDGLLEFEEADFEAAEFKQFYFRAVPKMRSVMRNIFRSWEKAMLKQLEKMKSLVPAGINEKGEGVPVWSEEMLEREKWAATINRKMGAPIRSQIIHGGVRGLRTIGSGISFNVLNPEIQTFLEEYTFHFSAVVSRDVSDAFAREMQRAFEAGESIPQMRDRVSTFFDGMQTWKAEQIARSESSRSSHVGMVKGWQQSGEVAAVVWDAQADACPFCDEMDGKVVALGESFFNEGDHLEVVTGQDAEGNDTTGRLNFNYEAVESPPLHPNCRCTLRAELKGE